MMVQVDENGELVTVFNMLNHSDIESMTILKDASAAVHGSRASAGVILVKTKRICWYAKNLLFYKVGFL